MLRVVLPHSSEIGALCLMKCHSKMLQKNFHGVIHFSLGGKYKVAQSEKRKKLLEFSYSKNMANFEAFFTRSFHLKHKPLISEE